MRFETLQVRAGYHGDPVHHASQAPIYLTNGYTFDNMEHARKLFALEEPGYIYTRLNNPTNDMLEQRLAALDGGQAAVVTASGHSALTMAMLNLCSTGDEIVSARSIYGGAFNLFSKTLSQMGIQVRFVDAHDPQAFEAATTDKTRAYFIESIGNPLADVPDIQSIAKAAHQNGIPLIVDNTVATPYLLRPFDFGADITVYSSTKYLVGNGTVLGGAVVDAGTFDYKDNPRFPSYNKPDDSYHGLIYAQALGKMAFITKLRTHILRDIGAAQSPFHAWLTCLGLETLSLRMDRHSSNALAVANYLQKNPAVAHVYYPKLASSPYYHQAQTYLPRGASATFSADLAGGRTAAAAFCDHLKLFNIVANLGDARSMVNCPALTTHSQLSDDELAANGIQPGSVRFSVGLEHIDDLLEDLEQAFHKIP